MPDSISNLLDIVHQIRTTEDVSLCCRNLGFYVLAQQVLAVRFFKEPFSGVPDRLRLLAQWLDKVCTEDTDPEIQEDLRKWADLLENN